jgi:hypothetical protein
MCCLVRTTAYVKGSHRLVRSKYEHCLGNKTGEMWTKHVSMKLSGTESKTLSSKTCAQLT